MIKEIVILALIGLVINALIIKVWKLEQEIDKAKMCEVVRRICDRDCEQCIWNHRRNRKNGRSD